MRVCSKQRGTVLILVLWISLGIAGLALYFGHTMMLDYRASSHMLEGLHASQTLESAARYIKQILSENDETGTAPDAALYSAEEVQVGEGYFWLIGRSAEEDVRDDEPKFGLVDEASKININVATVEMLETLPGVTPDIAAAIIDWRDENQEVSQDGAESETYLMLDPGYVCKDAPFETVEELRLVDGMDMTILYGEDLNRNGALDDAEDDAEETAPSDNSDGTLDFGLLEYVTVYSSEPNLDPEGEQRIDLNGNSTNDLESLLQEELGGDRAGEIIDRLRNFRGRFESVLDFYYFAGLSREEFDDIAEYVSVSDEETLEGLVNVNTAGKVVLSCIPGIGESNADALISYREKHADEVGSISWVTEVLDENDALDAGPYITTKSYQFSADVAAVGKEGRGYRRALMVFDVSSDSPTIVYRRDLSALGWALGKTVRDELISREEGWFD